MRLKKILMAVLLSGFLLPAAAQTREELSETYSGRYDLVVSKLGYAGVGVDTILNQWEQVDSTNVKMLTARFNYYFTKAQSSSVVVKPEKKYLGADPVLTLKDSTGRDVYYYQEVSYDDALFSDAMRYLDKAIEADPFRIDLRFTKVTALMSYEKDSPDMALSYLLRLVDKDASEDCVWVYPGYEIGDDFFKQSMQEYCAAFYTIGTPSSYEAFRTLSERMLMIYPKDAVFITNLGTYDFIVAKDYPKALKYYKKALKIAPDDYSALKNCVLLARRQKDNKLEKKYLEKFAAVAPENERQAAEARLKYLDGQD
ncbi:MAG: hypothetical protein IAC29_06225 [Bacteroidetes bacterium]|uniref:Tetratricopeptide repeat protein n=1 Tax=Candidatus Cryptobacteroides merdigallinarum TaxID=2840770 RepID=A0A9D9ELL8_9BACT|nr:hypothetical protein [Candidatus Cryptobacteroides merdigallinarum]